MDDNYAVSLADVAGGVTVVVIFVAFAVFVVYCVYAKMYGEK